MNKAILIFKMKREKEMNVLLALLPFWDPQVPPVGIASLKSFISRRGYRVKTVDANLEEDFRGIRDEYLRRLEASIPEEKRRHLYNIGYTVLRNHLMGHQNVRPSEPGSPGYYRNTDYIGLIKKVIYNTFFHQVEDDAVEQLDRLVRQFYIRLKDYILELLERERPSVLGVSVYSDTLPASLFALRLTRETYPDIRTVMGGGIFSGELTVDNANFPTFLEQTPYIDKIVVGEGEALLLELLEGRLPEDQRVFTLQDAGHKPMDLDTIGLPDFSDFDPQYYTIWADYTSRSCPFQCGFCVETVYWGRYRKKSPARIADELTQMHTQYGHQLFLMCDSLLNPVISGLAQEFLDRPQALYWGGYLRADKDVCSPDNVLLWRRGGFYRARLGLESGSQKILQAMGKKIAIEQVKAAVYHLASVGIKTTTYWVIGYPGETEEDFQQTLDLIEELKDDIYEADCNPFWYFYGGQVKSGDWQRGYQSIPLYSKEEQELLLLQTWTLDREPSRLETYERVNRFIRHIRELGIPNPYSLDQVYRADERWSRLHHNAVPPLTAFQDHDNNIEECKSAAPVYAISGKQLEEDGDFGF
jgi:radical SAM superfamily enzyme YgiQ (UPF0313 family)